jgi:nucleotide-binding universal stress UspA family protein
MSIDTKSKKQETLLVALSLDDHSQQLLKVAEGFCLRTGMKLRLVHVCPTIPGPSWPIAVTGQITMSDVIDAGEEMSRQHANEQLEELKKQLNPSIDVTTNVMSGDGSTEIIADATSQKACLILAGASAGSHRWIPKSLSTTLSLMSESPVPVMIVAEGTTLDLSKGDFHLLITDDLRDSSLNALKAGFECAKLLEVKKISHVHVSGLTKNVIETTIHNAMAVSHGALDGAQTTETVFKAVEEGLKKQMLGRIEPWLQKYSELRAHYEPVVLHGPVETEIENYAKSHALDAIVFGRHHSFHRRPFIIGQVPFNTMLAINKPIIVAGQ